MDTEKFVVRLNGDQHDVTIRETNEVNELKVKEPIKIDVVGTIGTIVEFLSKRWNATDGQINKERTHVRVCRDNLFMQLITNEHDQYNEGKITGAIALSKQFKVFGINDDSVEWDPVKLGQFFKMNRAFFADRQENMTLVSLLKSFVAKVDTIIEREKKENGSFKDNYSGVVNANIPGSFKLNIPVFKGGPKETLEVEFYANVSGRDVTLSLCSPDANVLIEEMRDKAFDEQIEKIREIAPEIPILEL